MSVTLSESKALQLFKYADIEVVKVHKLVNRYVPDCDVYAEYIRRNPWFLLETSIGLIVIGARKRVFSIDWSSTKLRHVVTDDDVTRNDTMVHAWSVEDAVRYLKSLRKYAESIKEVANET